MREHEGTGSGTTAVAEGTVIGDVRIERLLGRGGMGSVYLGRQPGLDRQVAIKVVREALAEDEEFHARFRREVKLAASLEHPHIVPVYYTGEDDGRLYVVMRFLDGVDLRTAVRRHGPMPHELAVRVVDHIGAALDAAHERGLVHRDVKPANIMITGRDADLHAYLTDFGLAKAVAGTDSLTAQWTVVGTADYMAPEQFEGIAVDGRADVYALGCVLHEALTGSVPFPRDSDMNRMYAHCSVPPPRPCEFRAGLPGGFDAVVARGMAKSPSDRFAHAGELARAAAQAATTRPSTRDSDRTVVGTPRGTGPWSNPSHPSAPSRPSSSSVPGPRAGSGPWTPHGGATAGYDPMTAMIDPGTLTKGPNRRRWWLIGAAAAAAVLLLVATVPLWPRGNPAGEVDGAPVAVGAKPQTIIKAAGAAWIPNAGDGTVTRIDPSGDSSSVTVGGEPSDVAVEAGSVWAWNYSDSITRHDLATGTNSSVFLPAGAKVTDLESGGGYVWITGAVPNALLRVNPTNNAVETFPVAGGPTYMVAGEQTLYVLTSAPMALVAVDTANGQVLGTPLPLPGSLLGTVDLVDGILYVWTSGPPGPNGQGSSSIIPVDERTYTLGSPIQLGDAISTVFGNGSYWTVNPFSSEIRRFSLADRTAVGEPISGVGRGTAGVALLDDRLLVLDADARTVSMIDVPN